MNTDVCVWLFKLAALSILNADQAFDPGHAKLQPLPLSVLIEIAFTKEALCKPAHLATLYSNRYLLALIRVVWS